MWSYLVAYFFYMSSMSYLNCYKLVQKLNVLLNYTITDSFMAHFHVLFKVHRRNHICLLINTFLNI